MQLFLYGVNRHFLLSHICSQKAAPSENWTPLIFIEASKSIEFEGVQIT